MVSGGVIIIKFKKLKKAGGIKMQGKIFVHSLIDEEADFVIFVCRENFFGGQEVEEKF